jgi:signal transduction histidine kinase
MTRIHGIRATVSTIIQGDLSQRLQIDPSPDELNTLSQTINGMLDQTEQLVHGIRNVSNAIAHDLRTPLAELRSRLEELALTKPSADVTFEEIDSAVADVDRVISIFNALLRLAEIDSGMRRSGFVAVDVADIAAAAVEFYQPAAELRDIRLSFDSAGPAPARGDALKYTPERGVISVAVRTTADRGVEVVVADCGPGIPDSEKPKVVERFYRGDASRGTPGVGLGLALVEAVARLHGSSLELQDNHPGLKARIMLNHDTPPVARAARAVNDLNERGELQHEPVYP